MGIRITTDEHGVRVWRSDRYGYAQYNVSIQKKKDDGGYITMYKQVKFRGGIELENGSEIIIRDAFPSIDTWNDKQSGELMKKEVWVIMDFVYKDAAPKRQSYEKPQQARVDTFDDLPDTFQAAEDEIPFRA